MFTICYVRVASCYLDRRAAQLQLSGIGIHSEGVVPIKPFRVGSLLFSQRNVVDWMALRSLSRKLQYSRTESYRVYGMVCIRPSRKLEVCLSHGTSTGEARTPLKVPAQARRGHRKRSVKLYRVRPRKTCDPAQVAHESRT